MMTTEEQIIAVAEWQGWKRETRRMYGGIQKVKGWGFNMHLSLGDRDRKFVIYTSEWPAWDKDLNAIIEATGKLDHFQQEAFLDAMCHVLHLDNLHLDNFGIWCLSDSIKAINASAPQRLEALCRTLWPERWKE